MSDNHDHPHDPHEGMPVVDPPGDSDLVFPDTVYPGLLPVQWRVAQVTLGEDGPDPLLAVMLELRTPAGIHITFWPEGTALDLAQRLFEEAEPTSRGEVRQQPVDGPVPDADS